MKIYFMLSIWYSSEYSDDCQGIWIELTLFRRVMERWLIYVCTEGGLQFNISLLIAKQPNVDLDVGVWVTAPMLIIVTQQISTHSNCVITIKLWRRWKLNISLYNLVRARNVFETIVKINSYTIPTFLQIKIKLSFSEIRKICFNKLFLTIIMNIWYRQYLLVLIKFVCKTI